MLICAKAPSNIALIKYMGKVNSELNIPENPSLSMTLNNLCSFAEVSGSSSDAAGVSWVPELPQCRSGELSMQMMVPQLSESGVRRILKHFERTRRAAPEIFRNLGIQVNSDQNFKFVLKTANTFPAASGIASSASSFAAVTLAAAATCASDSDALEKAWQNEPALRRALAEVSRQGSGSSCRSFEGPWVTWEGEKATRFDTASASELAHMVVLVQSSPKKVSSSQAHLRVRSSPLWEKRVERVTARYQKMRDALRGGALDQVARLAWSETWEMHSLFHTSEEPFSYWGSGTMEVLQRFTAVFEAPASDRGALPGMTPIVTPIVTLDAGPNIHLIVEKSSKGFWKKFLSGFELLEDEPGNGAEWILQWR